MQIPAPITVRTRPGYQVFVWAMTLLLLAFAVAVLVRAVSFIPLMRQDLTLTLLFLPVALLFALGLWLGRWALFHTTVRIEIDREGLAMRSAVATDSLRWEEIERIRLQASSGSEAQLSGNGHRVTLPSGSATPLPVNEQVQDWITYQLNERDLEYGHVHFWGP